MSDIKAVIFDWGGVLIDNPTLGLEVYCSRNLGIPRAEYRREFRKHERAFQTGTLTESALWATLCDNLHVRTPKASSLWYEAFSSVYFPKHDVFRIAESLHRAGYRIGLLSNTEVPAMRFFIERNYRMFDATAFSCAIGVAKPDPAAFRWIAERLESDPRECVFIDDTKACVTAAADLGMHGITFRDARRLVADLRRLGVRTIV